VEVLLMIGNVGTAVVMFPILRRYSEALSLSYVASRTIEATIIGVGAISLDGSAQPQNGRGLKASASHQRI